MDKKVRACVVICYWTGRSPKALFKLLRSMRRHDAGEPYDVVIVCNGGATSPLQLPDEFSSPDIKVLNRENKGWNLGAWEAGWRGHPGYEYFLFLQAECFIKAAGWLSRFIVRIDLDSGVGLLGERIMWDEMTWDYVKKSTEIDLGSSPALLSTVDQYQDKLRQEGIDPGKLGTHLVSIILFTKRTLLEEVNGFPLMGETYVEAVSCEIGFSKSFQNRGYRLSQLGDDAFFKIGHTQFTELERYKDLTSAFIRRQIRRAIPRKQAENRVS